MSNTTLHLFKQNFKFSSAHFLIFDEKHAEKLHGHNYQVSINLEVPPEPSPKLSRKLNPKSKTPNKGYFVDFNVFKKFIKAECDKWDEHVLLPAEHPDMKITKKNTSLEVKFRERFYVFPENEVILLPITNTSVEQLSRILAENFLKEFQKYGVTRIRVRVEETRGQGASTIASI